MLESYIEKKLQEAVKAKGGICLKLSPQFFEGVPDRLILLPGGRVDFVELKRPKGGRLSPRQKFVHTRFAALGQEVKIINTIEKVKEYVGKI